MSLMGERAAQVVVLDVETTGKERATDQIIELCLRFGLDPDNQSVPIITSVMDLFGVACVLLAMSLSGVALNG